MSCFIDKIFLKTFDARTNINEVVGMQNKWKQTHNITNVQTECLNSIEQQDKFDKFISPRRRVIWEKHVNHKIWMPFI